MKILKLILGIGLVFIFYGVSLAQEASPTITFTAFPKDLAVYPRDLSTNTAVVPIAGTVETPDQDEVILRVYRDGALITTLNQELSYDAGGGSFSFVPEIAAELQNYNFEFFIRDGTLETFVRRAEFVVAGDIYLINGQSNAMANQQDGSTAANPLVNQFLRSFGRRDYRVADVLADLDWHLAEGDGYWGPGYVGQWGLRMGRSLVDTSQVPIAILNGAHGGHAIKFYERDDSDPGNINTNYGRLLFRATEAGVAEGVRAMLWHQGEADGTNPVGHENGVTALYNDWHEDYPDMEKLYIFQIRNSTCGTHSIDLRNRQRLLPDKLPEVEVLSTTGLDGHDGCHFSYVNGYEEMGLHLFNIIDRDLYGSTQTENIDPPNIDYAHLSSNTEIMLVMRNPNDTLVWDDGAEKDFVLEGTTVTVTTGIVEGNKIRLPLSGDGSSVTHVSYIGHPFSGPWVTNANRVGLLAFRVALTASTNIPPEVSITSPTEGASFVAGSDVLIEAAANDSDGSISQVDFYREAVYLGTATAAPWQFTWVNTTAGSHTFTAVTTDDRGATGASTPVSILVNEADNQPPSIGITNPAEGTEITAGEEILIEADATDEDGTVIQVEFYAGTTLLGTDTAAPWNWIWEGALEGSHGLTAVARDDDGENTTSAMVNVTVASSQVGDVALAIEPNVQTVALGEQFSVIIKVHADAQNVSGAAAYINFDPAALTIVGVEPGDTLTTTLQNQHDNEVGTLDFAAGAELGGNSYPSGAFVLATITLQANVAPSVESTVLTHSTTPPRRSEVTFGSDALPTTTQDGAVTFDGANLTGLVTLQRESTVQAKPHPSWQIPLLVRLFKPGELAPAYTFTPSTDESGVFHLYGIAPGEYAIAIKHSHTLQNALTVMMAAGNNEANFDLLREGDADDSNDVGLIDFSILAQAFGHCEPVAGYNGQADFNQDGCVTLFDFSLLSMNYAEQGDPTPGSAQVSAGESLPVSGGAAEDGAVKLVLSPVSSAIQVGQEFEVVIQVEAGTQEVDVVGAFLNFDPAVLQVVGITSGNMLPDVMRSVFDNGSGAIGFETGKLGGPFPNGSFALATIRFKALDVTPETLLLFSQEPPRRTNVYQAGISQLRSIQDQSFSVEPEAASELYLPLLETP